MIFTEQTLAKAAAVVNIFETSRPNGSYTAVAILNDGAGISYGISQFTHRSGALAAVVAEYLAAGGTVASGVLAASLPTLRSTSSASIKRAAGEAALKKALAAAGITAEMHAAQRKIAFERYMRPALEICLRSGFRLPLSLAVVLDSLTHGSWDKIARGVSVERYAAGTLSYEKARITEYVRRRAAWLKSVPRLRATAYRTAFFLERIKTGNWELELPFVVNGYRLTAQDLQHSTAGTSISAALPAEAQPEPADSRTSTAALPETARPSISVSGTLDAIQERVNDAANIYDRVETIVQTVGRRNDAAKSLWTTVIGSVWQSVWAVISFFIGLPKEVWLVVAVIVAVTLIIYLYRQIELGRIREKANFGGNE